ncbi:MAG: glycosyltransferase family 9 protein [Victivallaceae bacterium]|nr:glycosyltransferase family 9 protein [Victivallaceae bacterium]
MSKKILIYYTGTIGDTIIAFPAFQMVRQSYPDAHITLLNALYGRQSTGEALLKNTGYVDSFINYALQGRCWKNMAMVVKLVCKLRAEHFDELIYFARDDDAKRRKRDRMFFALAGIHVFRGINRFLADEHGKMTKSVSQQIVDNLTSDGVGVPCLVESYGDFRLSESEKRKANLCFYALPIPMGSTPIVYGIGGKNQNCKWPLEKHCEVLKYLVNEHHLFPLFFGDDSSKQEEELIIERVGCGIRVAPYGLSLRESIAAMAHCRLYVGHDTGTMHMAAAAGLPCAGVFSSRDPEGKWYPPGKNKRVFLRHHCDCEGCGRTTCFSYPARCIDMISVGEVVDVVEQLLYRGIAKDTTS